MDTETLVHTLAQTMEAVKMVYVWILFVVKQIMTRMATRAKW